MRQFALIETNHAAYKKFVRALTDYDGLAYLLLGNTGFSQRKPLIDLRHFTETEHIDKL